MTKDNEKSIESETEKQEVLTEWQKRNQDFLKKKEKDKLEQEAAEKRLNELKQNNLLGNKIKEETDDSRKKKKKEKKQKLKKPKKEKSVKVKNSHRRRFILVFSLSLLLLIFAVIMVSPLSKSKKIVIKGNDYSTKQSIIAASQIKSQDYLLYLFFDQKDIANRIVEDDPWVETAKVSYQFPNQFTLKVKEHKIVGYTQKNKVYYPVLDNGFIVNEQVKQLPSQFLDINLTEDVQVKEFVNQIKHLNSSVIKNIHKVKLEKSKSTKNLLSIEMFDGNIVKVPLTKIEERLSYYPKVIQNITPPRTIDMEVGIYITSQEGDEKSDNTNTSSDANSNTTSSN